MPALDPRIPRLAAQIAGSAPTNYDKAALLETYLKTHYGYTLQLPFTTPNDPLSNFLFERKQGHCEYFASSMAVMLRTLGIPARVVNGFRSGLGFTPSSVDEDETVSISLDYDSEPEQLDEKDRVGEDTRPRK